MTDNEITYPLETTSAVDDVDEFVRFTNLRLDEIYPQNAFSEYANLMLPEDDPRVDKNDKWEKRARNAAENYSKDYSLKVERGAGKAGAFTLRCKTSAFKKHYDWLLEEYRLYGWLKDEPAPEQARGERPLSGLENGIIQAIRELQDHSDRVTDEGIAAWLAKKGVTNKEGKPYTREWISKTKNKLRDEGKLKL